eukprot:gene465-589_t
MTIKLLKLNRFPILKQLQLEEALYRNPNAGNWMIINKGTPEPSIIVGVSGRAQQLVDLEKAKQRSIPIIKRFTGGGTVIVDEDTLFCSFVMNLDWLKQTQKLNATFPRDIMNWTGQFYSTVFKDQADFSLKENDYSFGDRKFGGNAQSFSRKRFVHHTSFLYDFLDRNITQWTWQSLFPTTLSGSGGSSSSNQQQQQQNKINSDKIIEQYHLDVYNNRHIQLNPVLRFSRNMLTPDGNHQLKCLGGSAQGTNEEPSYLICKASTIDIYNQNGGM